MNGAPDAKARAPGARTALGSQLMHDGLSWAHDATRRDGRPAGTIRCPVHRPWQVLRCNRIEVLRRLGVLALEGAAQRHLQAVERPISLLFPLAHHVNKPTGQLSQLVRLWARVRDPRCFAGEPIGSRTLARRTRPTGGRAWPEALGSDSGGEPHCHEGERVVRDSAALAGRHGVTAGATSVGRKDRCSGPPGGTPGVCRRLARPVRHADWTGRAGRSTPRSRCPAPRYGPAAPAGAADTARIGRSWYRCRRRPAPGRAGTAGPARRARGVDRRPPAVLHRKRQRFPRLSLPRSAAPYTQASTS
jgi:hypothetical protein